MSRTRGLPTTGSPVPIDDAQSESLSEHLLAELSKRAGVQGANAGRWPGLTIYRFTRPTQPRWNEIESLSICVIAQGSGAITVIGGRRLYGQIHYIVIGSGRHFDCQILEASPDQPALCFVVEIPPQLVRSISVSMHGLHASSEQPVGPSEECAVSTPGADLVDTVVRFVGSLSAGCDRRVLAPLHLRELVYRTLRSEQRGRLLQLAAYQAKGNPIAAALDYIPAHLAEPLTVHTLAAQVSLSPSAFSRTFREVTGRSPYQYVKEARLDRARRLLDEGRLSVADVSRSVGYTSVSHFIKGFRSRFGVTPGDYADAQRVRLRVGRCLDGRATASPCDVAS